MKKRLKRLLNNRGMTLTELIVAMFLTSVILAIAVGLLAPVTNMMNSLKSNAHMDTVCSTVSEYIRGSVHTAKSVTIVQLDAGNNFIDPDGEEEANSAIGSGAKVLAVLNISPANTKTPVYRVFDFGQVADLQQLKGLIAALPKDKYVFFDPFYGSNYKNTSLAVDFYNDGGARFQFASQCKIINGDKLEAANQKHILNAKLLNGSVRGTGVSKKIDVTDTDHGIEGHGYLIIYTPSALSAQ